ncbi:restriction endonuclease subunit R [Spirulina sp. 06S082]|uniref:restriction endonuclease subunit R n=1 Tax=Spirulina sp. 06S082 TaxID=3110248 RepID=UPI002B219593|nr:restriction endonuclease subunit R [Spirulina sp. 06S082]MEA5469625.1 restriction endonuclease subunit R [Spirulina sp. 06S082]
MVQTIQTQNIDMRYAIDNFGIHFNRDENFFREWQENLPEITNLQKQLLDQVQEGYFNLLEHPPLLEGVVKMAILDPILFIGGFFLDPFYVKSEQSIDIAIEDEDVLVRGRIDSLVLKENFWVMVIESKKFAFSTEEGLAQLLVYMLANPHPEKQTYGMVTTGGSFLFVKLLKTNVPQYATSRLFGIRNAGDLYEVLRILKRLTQIVTIA